MCLHLDRDGDVAGAKDLDGTAGPHGTLGGQALRRDLATFRKELPESGDVHYLVFDPEAILEALELRNPADQWHLAAFEAGRHSGPGLGALGATPRGLALGRLTT